MANYLSLLEATHLIFRLHPFGYGKVVKHVMALASDRGVRLIERTPIVRVPAVAWCWWAGACEHRGHDRPFV